MDAERVFESAIVSNRVHCNFEGNAIPNHGGVITRTSGHRDSRRILSSREDSALLSRILTGDSQAMALLYDKYSELVYSASMRILRDPAEAEDVLQDVFLRIWRFPEQVMRDRSLAPYLAVISRNRSIDILRKRLPLEPLEHVALASPDDMDLRAEQALLCEKARELMEECPIEQRKAMEMAYFKGMTHSEIAEVTGTPLGTIKSRIRKDLSYLRGSSLFNEVSIKQRVPKAC